MDESTYTIEKLQSELGEIEVRLAELQIRRDKILSRLLHLRKVSRKLSWVELSPDEIGQLEKLVRENA